ncbi:MAG TPA: tetratricopeptide repeat protein [Burkholderiales bacterium]|nr:tetratricopeptide repeat protein [Burkholderiales bacterium]
MHKTLLHALIIAALSAPAFAMDTPKPDPKDPEKKSAVDTSLAETRAAIARSDWTAAQAAARRAVERNPQSADAHNLYAYSLRKGPNPQMDLVFRHYNEALRLDPQHRAAREYLGEAYLMTGNVAKAKELLAELDRLCQAGCAEQAALQRSISTFEHQHAAK